ncbi:MAG: glucuronate isomerase, partial [Flavobacteriaceae bacterium]|nr:glucuronate isomerase [Flavobacteriaceae bacterium]
LWLADDHYKWRAMRTLGVDEKFITGSSKDEEKFKHYATVLPYLIRNPLYHWSHLELLRYFGFNDLLHQGNWQSVYELTKSILQKPEYSAMGLLKQMNVSYLCTTESPLDDLKHHISLAKSDQSIQIKTSFRPDVFLTIGHPQYTIAIEQLESIVDRDIKTIQHLKDALVKRLHFFHQNGCRLCDHGLEAFPFDKVSEKLVEQIFKKRLKGMQLTKREIHQFQTHLLLFLSQQYHQLKWVQQFHVGAYRNANTRMFHQMGPDKGWDSIGSSINIHSLMSFMDQLDQQNSLTKTIIYNLNPSDNATIASLIGNFNHSSMQGKIQWGASWWYLDQIDGITQHFNTLSHIGVVSTFIGMLTDSRSFLSFPRHEYFRRIVCHLLGDDINKGKLPIDYPWIGKIAADISYFNAKSYFDIQ